MKKSIKYAGIAAATLLAVAPVAAPVVSSTTNAQAAITDDQTTQDAVVTAFGAQFKDQAAKGLLTKDASGASVLNGVSLGKFDVVKSGTTTTSGNATFADANKTLVNNAQDLNYGLLNSKGQATAQVTATYGGVNVKDNADLQRVLADTTYPEVVFTITLSYNNMNGAAQTKTYTEKALRDSTSNVDEMTTANATFTTPLSVALKSTTTSTVLNASNDATIKDQNGNSVLTTADNVTANDAFYDTYSAAIDSITKSDVATTAKTNVGVNTDNGQESFLKSGTYYQVITFTAGNDTNNSALKEFLEAYKTNPSKYSVYVNGKKASAGYDFVATANATTSKQDINFVREINVSKSTDSWTVADTTGVVTTKDASKYYTLKNDDNVTIANRALGANTAWKADKVRTNQDGVKQFRVATGEWIDADNVTFSNGNDNNNASGLTDIKTVSGVATLTKPAGYFMTLFGDNGKALDNMMLASQTAWRVDRTAKDANGVTYYRVATGEWLQAGEGVSFK